jgi:hypothetical protein
MGRLMLACSTGSPRPYPPAAHYPRLDSGPWLTNKIVLRSHDDWSPLLYDGGSIGQASLVAPPPGSVANETEPTPQEREEAGLLLEPRTPVPPPTVVGRSAQSVTLQVVVTPANAGTVSWAPAFADRDDGDAVAVATALGGRATIVRFTVPIAGTVALSDPTSSAPQILRRTSADRRVARQPQVSRATITPDMRSPTDLGDWISQEVMRRVIFVMA